MDEDEFIVNGPADASISGKSRESLYSGIQNLAPAIVESVSSSKKSKTPSQLSFPKATSSPTEGLIAPLLPGQDLADIRDQLLFDEMLAENPLLELLTRRNLELAKNANPLNQQIQRWEQKLEQLKEQQAEQPELESQVSGQTKFIDIFKAVQSSYYELNQALIMQEGLELVRSMHVKKPRIRRKCLKMLHRTNWKRKER